MQPAAPSDPAEDRHGRILAELAGMGLELARDLRERALAAGTAEEATSLARAFQSISRGVRQTLALELKVARFRHELRREAQAARGGGAGIGSRIEAGAGRDRPEPAVLRRREAVAVEVERLIYCEEENEGLDDEAFDRNAARRQRSLNAWLEAAAREPDFTTDDLDWQIIEACEAVGVDPGRLYDLDGAADEAEDQDAATVPPPDPAHPVHADTG